jgi:arabinose-5-phosphate isomerase
MHTGEEVPLVTPETPMEDVLVEMTSKRLGITGVAVDGKLVGVITDGDLRRALKRFSDLLKRTAGEIMTHHPKTISPSMLVEKAIALMEEHKITCLFVVDEEQKVIGVIHMHDLISKGVR